MSSCMASWAKAAGASTRLSERAAADIPSATRVLMVISGHPFENGFRGSIRRNIGTIPRSRLLPLDEEFSCMNGCLKYPLEFTEQAEKQKQLKDRAADP